MSAWLKRGPTLALIPLFLGLAGCSVDGGGIDGESNFVRECPSGEDCEDEAATGDTAGDGEFAAPSNETLSDSSATPASADSTNSPAGPADAGMEVESGGATPMDTDDSSRQLCVLGQEACTEGFKCTEVWGADNSGLSWSGHACNPVEGTKPTGEICEHFDRSSEVPGIHGYRADDCDAANYCLGRGALTPTCRPYCLNDGVLDSTGDCPNGDRCTNRWTTNFGLCTPECDPTRTNACPMGLVCNLFDRNGTGVFLCAPTLENAAQDERCQTGQSCGHGLACERGVPACAEDNNSCCTAYCDVNDGSSCAAVPGTTCQTPELFGPLPNGLGVCTQ